MPLCGRLFPEAKALFLFGLRAKLRIYSCCRGLTGKNREQGSGRRTTTASTAKAQWLRRRPVRKVHNSFSDALVHKRNKVTRVLEQVAPFRVIARARLSCDNFR